MEKTFIKIERVLAAVLAFIGVCCIVGGFIHLSWHLPIVGAAYLSLARVLTR